MIFPIFSYTFQIEAETCVSASKSFMRFFMSNSIGLYIHIPFCKHKCPYCDFFSGNAGENAFDNYVIVLKDKIKGECPIVAGGPDVGNWDTNNQATQEQENQAIVQSVKACMNVCDVYFLFDMFHLKKADQWQYAKEGIKLAIE